jgi:AcrR family transcriptional regulator
MRRRPAPAPDSRQRILDAATAEFALRGFAAATVDRIAARARLNKAMIYYHFHSKQALYTAVLRSIFTTMGDRLTAIASADADPADKLDRFVATFVTEGQARSHVAPIMLREIAEGGRRLDDETYGVMVRVVRAMSAILDQGRASGQFGPVDPILLYLTTVWPIVVYLATTPIRRALARVARFDVARLDPEPFIAHLQMLNRHAVMPTAPDARSTGETS